MPVAADPLAVGVIGVGNMGWHHARVYGELPDARLAGVVDTDRDRAARAADTYDTRAMDRESLLRAVDAVSIAVPDRHHFEVARAALDAGVHVLVEKPFVEQPSRGRDLIDCAAAADVVLQVGHVERFNPAVETLATILEGLDVIAIDANRLGPPLGRDRTSDPVLDLMIHDIDVVRWLLDEPIVSVRSMGADSNPHVTALLESAGGVVASLTASRVTQQKIRTLSVTAAECRINVDYLDQSVEIHRRSIPKYLQSDGDLRYRHESVIERPTVGNGEPLYNELSAFVAAARDGTTPRVTGEDGLSALALANRIRDADAGRKESPREAVR